MKIIIVGAGEVGYHIANRLCAENKNVVVIDKNTTAIQHIGEQLDVQTIHGSGSNPTVLEEAGLKQAEIILAVTDSDETNLVYANSKREFPQDFINVVQALAHQGALAIQNATMYLTLNRLFTVLKTARMKDLLRKWFYFLPFL